MRNGRSTPTFVRDLVAGLVCLILVGVVLWRLYHQLPIRDYVVPLCAWTVLGAVRLITGTNTSESRSTRARR